ncbi:heavy metal translocating P-type ATPase [Tannockella kyphosi]|uniref:heavy metal translocating P-type ATPase n=1 Tax=Tannockella kyphosi TaxID=2899121 RepID=UPI002012FE5B|nr:heavy metal translocating P-type ATPase [Tannockella kyphosi]
MKYKIVCDKPGRLRLRFGKYVFSKGQCFALADMLLSYNGIENAYVNDANGSVLIEYRDQDLRNTVLELLANLSVYDLSESEGNEEQKTKQLEEKIKTKVMAHCVKQFAKAAFLPTGCRGYLACYRAIPYFKMGLHSLKEQKLNVEVLDATAIGTSLCCKNYKTASSTMFLLQLSDMLLEYANMRAKNALAQSLSISVDRVWLVKDNVEIEIPMEEVQVGDVIKIRQGSLIPIDGTIVSGDAFINESTMTGEPLAVHKSTNGSVFAGTVIEDGEINVMVESLRNDSRIAKILNLIDTGEKEKANIQGNAERLADDIVPVSFGMFAVTLALTGNFTRALTVLMVDFSCAIKLTTPITIISALKESVNNSILIKGGKYLEILSEVDTVVFDKTGTLTNALPKVSKIIPISDEYNEDEILKVAACLEEHFPHSVALAIVTDAKEKGLLHPESHGKVEYIVAHGIASTYNDKRAIIGSKHFVFDDEKVTYPIEKEGWLTEMIANDSAVYLAIDGILVGVVCVNDPPRKEAKEMISLLYEVGIQEVIMITGDSEGNAKYTCDLLGIQKYYSSVLPDGKANIVESLKTSGKTVLMVGDGINDAPALSAANVSLTLNGSSDIAREVADISVLHDDLMKIVEARKLATGLIDKIHQQYGMIVSFNTVLIILGLLGVIPATTSAWLHNSSTLAIAAYATKPIQQ